MTQPRRPLTPILFVCSILLATFLFPGCGGDSKDKPLVCATEAQFPPFEFKDASGNLTGFDIELVHAVGEKIGRKIAVQDMAFAGIIPALQSGQIQMAIAGMSVTEERKKSVLFSDPYIEAGLSIIVPEANSTIKTSQDLKGKTAAVHLGSTGAKAAEELKAAGKLGNVLTFQTATLAIMELLKGSVDCVIHDTPYCQAFMKKEPGKIKPLDEVIASDSYAIAFNLKSTELQAQVNKALAELVADGTVDKLKVKYFAE